MTTRSAEQGRTPHCAPVVALGASRDYKPHLIPNHAATAMPPNMMAISSQSMGSRSSLIQALIDVGAIFAGVVLISVFAIAVAVAAAIPLFVNLKF